MSRVFEEIVIFLLGFCFGVMAIIFGIVYNGYGGEQSYSALCAMRGHPVGSSGWEDCIKFYHGMPITPVR